MTYTITTGKHGVVYNGSNKSNAMNTYDIYVNRSKDSGNSSSGTEVKLTANGKTIHAYVPNVMETKFSLYRELA